MSTLTPADLKALEHTRQRLFQLTNSLSSLQNALLSPTSDPLPSWPSLHASAQIISTHLTTLSTHLSIHHSLLSSLVVYPLPSFPARTQEGTLTTLLRKKLEPWVEEWVDAGQAKAVEADQQATGLKGEQLGGLWEWAGGVGYEEAQRKAEERGRVGEEEESDEDEEDEDEKDKGDKMEGVETEAASAVAAAKQKATSGPTGPPMKIEEIFRFVSRGTIPGTGPTTGAAAMVQGARWK